MVKSKLVVIICMLMLLMNGSTLLFPIEQKTYENSMINQRIQAVISPIVITSTEDFHAQAIINGWNVDGRDGDRGNGYLISGDTVNGGSTSIDIRNARVYFYIENCQLLSPSSYGIYLENVSYGIITDNYINNTGTGIQVLNSHHIQIRSNTIENVNHGIYLYRGVNNSFVDSNTIDTGGYGGITVNENCNDNRIANNNISDVGSVGIYVTESNRINVSANYIDSILGSNAYGISVSKTNDSFFNWNKITNVKKFGFTISWLSCHNEIAYNNFTESGEIGIYFYNEWARFNKIYGNYLDYHYTGIVTGDNNSVYDNYVQDTMVGISVGSFSNVSSNDIFDCNKGIQINEEFSLIEDNSIEQCPTGIYGYYSVNNTVSANSIYNCSNAAITMTQSYDYTFIDNIITECKADLKFSVTSVNQLRHTFINNLVDGKEIIYIADTVNPTIPNDFRRIILINCSDFDISGQIFEHTQTAILAVMCTNVDVHHNIFRFVYVAIEAQLCENVTFTSNEIHNSTGTGLYLFNIENLLIYNNYIHHSTFLQSSANAAVYLYSVDYVEIKSNDFYQNSGYAVYSELSLNITFTQNQVSFMGYGIISSDDQYVSISNNKFSNCTYGLRFFRGYYGEVYGNWIENITYEGVYLSSTGYFNIYLNNFIDTNWVDDHQVEDISGTSNVFWRNFYNDHLVADANSDGFKDSDYTFPSNSDNSSLISPYYISYPKILSPDMGEVVSKTIVISWRASTDSLGYSITYNIYLSPNNGDSWISLGKSLDVTSIELNTSEYENGTYLISVQAVNEELSIIHECILSFDILNLPRQLTVPEITFPFEGMNVEGTLNIQWEASTDIWNSSTPVKYSVYYSADEGLTWYELAVDLEMTAYVWITTEVDNGVYKIKVVSYTDDGLMKIDIISITIQNQITTTTAEIPTTITTTTTGTSTKTTTSSSSKTPGFSVLIVIGCCIVLILKRRKWF